ncbi:hypothetical protein J45TS6_05680 [Paenibacillus sp. J45TS6]|uniref:glycosyltransferase n=1 Tax=Paenibacillus sp. J45TS6 TaxID=2807196 RepID=UPI001B09CBA5|nr:glycosyltransferase [Paenibacillus sp. J45TS6]GIP42109.1 hypothetical protein J45TS6_05680 [Paenibacillus sp. J45TS6]
MSKNTEQPFVSIIIRTCQRSEFLERALISIDKQSVKDFEVIIVEDGQGDSEEMVQVFSHLPIKYYSTGKKVGRTKAANIGMGLSNGEYINFLDDDDLLLHNHIELFKQNAIDNPNYAVLHAASLERRVRYLSSSPLIMDVLLERVRYNTPLDKELIFFQNMFPIQAVMFKRSLSEEHGGMDETLDCLEDWDLWIRFSLNAEFKYFDIVTSVYHIPGKKFLFLRRKLLLKQFEKKIQNKYIDYIKKQGYKRPNMFMRFKTKISNK